MVSSVQLHFEFNKLKRFFTDLLALITSIASTAFLFISFHVQILGGIPRYIPTVILTVQSVIITALMTGVIILLAFTVYKEIRSKLFVFKVTWRKLEEVMKYVYFLAFYVSQLNMLITAYMVHRFGLDVELNVIKRFAFGLFRGNLVYIVISEVLTSAILLLFFYYLPKVRDLLNLTQISRELAYTLSDATGIFLLAIVISDFLNNYFFISFEKTILIALPLALAGFALIKRERRSMLKSLGVDK